MKVLTATQPWATLIAIGAKRIDTRSWATKYRGPLAIHASVGFGPHKTKAQFLEFCTANELVYAALEKAGLVPFTWSVEALMQLPRGQIIAVSELMDCKPITHSVTEFGGTYQDRICQWKLDEQERTFGDYRHGRYAWLLDDVQLLKTPVSVKGHLGLWNYEGALPV